MTPLMRLPPPSPIVALTHTEHKNDILTSMIALLTGKPIANGQELTLVVGGVGYEVKTTTQVLQQTAYTPELTLHIHTHVTQDSLQLFGFSSQQDKQLFKLLISVSGVGPQTALSILEKGSTAVVEAVQQADVSFFTGVKRVGKKAAQKIIIELKNKLGGTLDPNLGELNRHQADFVTALTSIGFAEKDAIALLGEFDFEVISLESALQQALKKLGK